MELRSVRRVLDSVIDIERYIQRLSLGRGGPRDFISLSNSLLKIENILSEVTSEYLCFWCSIVFSSLPTLLSDWKRLLKLPKVYELSRRILISILFLKYVPLRQLFAKTAQT